MITLSGLTKIFGATRVLDGLTLDVPTGQRIALIGSNGAGKTTLFRCLLGEYTHEGTVEVNGLDPRRHRTEVLRGVGFVPQIAPRLEMPVGALMRYVADVSGASVQEMESVARSLGLDCVPVRSRPFVKLSGGMKQKLLIAMALGRPTRLLILDEPAANLDPAARAVLFALLAERAAHATMIISSHRIDEVAALVNRVVELDHGRVVLDDTVSDAGALGSSFAVAIRALPGWTAFRQAAAEWQLVEGAPGVWSGVIAGPERLRFLGFAARHSGAIAGLSIEELPASHAPEVRDAVAALRS